MIITMRDMRRLDFCAAGVQAFFERENLDFNRFLQHGIEAEKLLATGSVFARKCVEAAKQAQTDEQAQTEAK